MHKLYLLLRKYLPEKEEKYLIDEIEKMVGRMNSGVPISKSLDILYPNLNIDRNNPLEILLLFIRGLKQNSFFEYVEFINGIKRGGRHN